MKTKLTLAAALSAVLAVAPLSQAQAHTHASGSNDALAIGMIAAGLTTAAIAFATPTTSVIVAQPPAPVYYVAQAPAYYSYRMPPRPYRQMVRYEPHHHRHAERNFYRGH